MKLSSPRVRLEWPGKTLTPSPDPVHELATVRAGDARCRLVLGDNAEALAALRSEVGGRAMLAYLDPPFLTGRTHDQVTRSRGADGEILRKTQPAFDDRWSGLDEYLNALAERIVRVRELLAPEGCLVLHVDPKTSHYAKVLCDEIFGQECFASEIVWRYRRWPSKTKNFQRVHDVLLRYVRDPRQTPRFNQLYEPLAASTRATWGTKKQRAVVDPDGRRRRSSTTSEATPGTPLGDVWEIGIVAPVAHERTGYPTQKPEALLERLIQACSQPGDLVIDPYAGSGTTLAVCARLGRLSIGIDDNAEAIALIGQRLATLGIQAVEEQVLTPEAAASARLQVA